MCIRDSRGTIKIIIIKIVYYVMTYTLSPTTLDDRRYAAELCIDVKSVFTTLTVHCVMLAAKCGRYKSDNIDKKLLFKHS